MGLRFPRLNNISFWCALFWLFYGCLYLLVMEFTPSLMNCYVIGMTRNTQIFYKASGSPDSEMDRGQEHAGKVEAGESYNLLQANVAMDECPYLTCETETTAFYHKCKLTLQRSGQSQCNCGVSYELNESLGVQPKATQTVK